MSRFAPFTLSAALVSAVVLSAPAYAQADQTAQFQDRYTALRAAMEARDADAIGKIFAPEYTMTDLRGEKRTGADMIARMQKMGGGRGGPGGGQRKIETKVMSANVAGDKAVVEQQLVAGGTRPGDDGKDHTMEMVMKSTDTWAKRGDAWLLVESVQTGMTVKRDGEVFFQEGK